MADKTNTRFCEIKLLGRAIRIDLLVLAIYVIILAIGMQLIFGIVEQCAFCTSTLAPARTISDALTSNFALTFYCLFIIAILFVPPFLTANDWIVLETLGKYPAGLTTWELKKAAKITERTSQRAVLRLWGPYLKTIGQTSKGKKYGLNESARCALREVTRVVTHKKSVGNAYNTTEEPADAIKGGYTKNRSNSNK